MKDCENCKFFCLLGWEQPCCFCEDESKWEPMEEEMEEKDNINPDHYKKETSLECIEAMEIIFGPVAVANFCACNAWKYIWRWKNKNGTEDLDKAMWYLLKEDDIAARCHSSLVLGELKSICDRMYAFILNTEAENADNSVCSE